MLGDAADGAEAPSTLQASGGAPPPLAGAKKSLGDPPGGPSKSLVISPVLILTAQSQNFLDLPYFQLAHCFSRTASQQLQYSSYCGRVRAACCAAANCQLTFLIPEPSPRRTAPHYSLTRGGGWADEARH